MLKLHARLGQSWRDEPFLVRLTEGTPDPALSPSQEAFLLPTGATELPFPEDQFRFWLRRPGAEPPFAEPSLSGGNRHAVLPSSLDHLTAGDILRVNPRLGEIWVMYRRHSPSNSLLLTEQCNSNCIMCSQPPKEGDDRHLIEAYLEAIPLMSPDTAELGLTGGEPMLLKEGVLQILAACRDHLPHTALHLLSNGRLFNYLRLCEEVQAIGNADLMIGIPLYADLAHRHDFVVQAAGAFDQTIRGIMNLERCGIPVEIRVVLHQQTIPRLPQLARFIARNLPFVSHVAFMGLENMGYVKMNLEALWIDPVDYQPELVEAAHFLDRQGIVTSIYNHQLCLLDHSLWRFSRQSIADWKREYVEVCDGCAARPQCGGFFFSASIRRSPHIHPLSAADLPPSEESVCPPC